MNQSGIYGTSAFSGFLWDSEVPPFFMADKLLKMKKKSKSHFGFFVLWSFRDELFRAFFINNWSERKCFTH